MPRDDDLSPRQKLRYRLAAIRSEQAGDGWDGLPLGGDLRGPRRSAGYPALVAAALGYA